MPVEVILCGNGHKFPLNRRKHEHETYVLCPKCKAEVSIRKKILRLPNLKWPEIKLHAAAEKAEMKRRAKRPYREDRQLFTPAHAQSAGLLAYSLMMAQKEMAQREKEKIHDTLQG